MALPILQWDITRESLWTKRYISIGVQSGNLSENIEATWLSSMKALCLAFLVITLSQLVSADSQPSYGAVQLYGDSDCTQARGGNISLEINSCLETNQSSAIAALSFPSCKNVQAILYISDQEQCRKPSFWPSISSGNVGDCLSLAIGSGIGSAAFVCVESVTTVSPGPTGQDVLVPSSQTAPRVYQTASSSTPSPTLYSPNPPASTGGLSQSDKANIAIGISIGLAALVAAVAGVWYARLGAIFQLMPQRVRWTASSRGPDPPPPYREFELYRRR